jgi:hypothetical protein
MSSEIIQSAAYNNYDDFQHDFHYLRIILMMKQTELRVRYSFPYKHSQPASRSKQNPKQVDKRGRSEKGSFSWR